MAGQTMVALAFHRITSLIDNDFYNFTMGQVAYKNYPELRVRYGFTNRTISACLADVIPLTQLLDELVAITELRVTSNEIAFLRSTGVFDEDYLSELMNVRLPLPEVEIVNGQFRIEYEGYWHEAILWETILLALVNQLYYWNIMVKGTLNAVYMEGQKRLTQAINNVKNHPDVKFIEFGTRRRFDGNWQLQVFHRLQDELPNQLVGTSNVWLAKQFGISPSGTMAHQLMMVVGATHLSVGESLREAQRHVLNLWENQYGDKNDGKLLVALTDTWGTDFFLRNVEPERVARWYGMRQDSGDPTLMAYKMIGYYMQNKIDMAGHVHVPSDGLTDLSMITLTEAFKSYMTVVSGCGTFWTNNVGLEPLSIVAKPILVDGVLSTVKLSDNIAKAMGRTEEIARYRKLVNYDSTFYERPTY